MDEWMNRIEAKLDRLTSASNFKLDPLRVELMLLAFKEKRKLDTIRYVREFTGLGLKDSKDLVEKII